MPKKRSRRPSQETVKKGKDSVEEILPTLQEEKKGKTFRKLSWEVMLMNATCKMFRRGLREYKEYEFAAALTRTDKERADTMQADKKYRHLTFGISRFKSSQDRFPWKGIRITQKRPEWRTQEEIKQLRRILLSLPSYLGYSINLQLMLAKVIRFERFGRRRVILRLGDPGYSFYFIYSGSVAITKDKDGSSAFIDSEPIILRRGVAFGEVALIQGSHRNATVVCMEDTELLAVDKEDFFANKLDVEQAKELKYRCDFFRSHALFASWSDQLIENVGGICKTEEYHHGQAIIDDSSAMASITFVTKGSCEMFRLVKLINCPSYHKWINQHMDQYQPTPAKSDPSMYCST
ncbi:cyclic nucleotide-binding domain-containing protein 2-like [Lissotriton helveticus]